MNTISRGIRNAFRNTIRTFSIISILGLSMGLALAMLVANQAVGRKIDSVKSSIGNTVNISPAGVRGFEGGGNPLTADQVNKLKPLDHVISVDETLNDRLTTENTNLQSAVDAGNLGQRNANNSGQGFVFMANPDREGRINNNSGTVTRTFTPPVILLGTTNPGNLSSDIGGGTFKLTNGQNIDGNGSGNVAIIGTSLATKNNLKVGSTFTAYGTTITVSGIFDAGNTFANNQVIMPLATVQKLSNQASDITSATVNVDSLSNIDSVTTAVKNVLGTSADVTNSADQAKQTLSPLENIQKISLYSLVGAVIAGAVIVLLTMIMIVRERRREIGVLKAIGASNLKVMFQFMTEATTLTVLASVIGMIIGVIAGNPITKLLVSNSNNNSNNGAIVQQAGRGFARRFGGVRADLTSIHGAIGWSIILYGLGAAILIAIIGSALASFFISKVRPSEVMRAE